jgi:hypothetical protein
MRGILNDFSKGWKIFLPVSPRFGNCFAGISDPGYNVAGAANVS